MSDFAMLFAIAVAVIVILLDLWAILSVFRSNKNVNTKALWAIGISLLPVIGLIAWGIAGPRGVVERAELARAQQIGERMAAPSLAAIA